MTFSSGAQTDFEWTYFHRVPSLLFLLFPDSFAPNARDTISSHIPGVSWKLNTNIFCHTALHFHLLVSGTTNVQNVRYTPQSARACPLFEYLPLLPQCFLTEVNNRKTQLYANLDKIIGLRGASPRPTNRLLGDLWRKRKFACFLELAEQAWKRHEDTSWQIGIKRTMLLQKQFSTLEDIQQKLAEQT